MWKFLREGAMAVITISRGTKSGGEEPAGRLSQRLGYKTIGREVIAECSRKYNIMEQDLLEELNHAPGLWLKLTREYSRQLIYIRCTLLACEVRAAIAADDKIWDQQITISAEGGTVVLKGAVKNEKLRDSIVTTASQVKGVTKCDVLIGLLTDPMLMGKYAHK